MNINVKNARRIAVLLCVLMLLVSVLSACVNTDNVPEIMDTGFVNEESVDVQTSEDDYPETEPGHTDAPIVSELVNITPTTVAVSGKCELGAVVRVTTPEKTVEVASRDGYFVVEVDLPYKDNILKITAQAEGEEESAEIERIASYNATADTRLDGNSVSVGVDSRLYFDKMLIDANGDNLYTASQLSTIQQTVSSNITTYIERSNGKEVEMIYVLIPNVTTIYPEIFPEGAVEKPATTVYDQVISTLSNTRATVIDMREIFRNELAKDSAYGPLFRITDSSMTDYAAYLTYSAIMDVVDNRFPSAKARAIDEFDWQTVSALGGNLVGYRELDNEVITESVKVATPKFNMSLGTNVAGSSNIASLVKFVDKEKNDLNYFTTVDGSDGINGLAERWVVDTGRSELPDAVIYRDYGSLAFADILLERFDRTMIATNGDFAFDAAIVPQYYPDYVIIMVSEDNMDTAFGITAGK